MNEDRYGQQFWRFLSTLSLRRATQDKRHQHHERGFLSTLSLRRATRRELQGLPRHYISIHALLAESDPQSPCGAIKTAAFLSTLSLRRATGLFSVGKNSAKISIHALLAESDSRALHWRARCLTFLSTLSLRRATGNRSAADGHPGYFYPRSPCGERPAWPVGTSRHRRISIHALLAESDLNRMAFDDYLPRFLSTLSLRRATRPSGAGCRFAGYFYPRSPCGERRAIGQPQTAIQGISIHALLAESDGACRPTGQCASRFLSTLSLRRATAKVHKTVGHFCAYETNFMEIASSC